jgi:hypothetical protein
VSIRYEGLSLPSSLTDLDSSAVVYMANHLIKTYGTPTWELQLITAVNDPIPNFDDLKLITGIEEHGEDIGISLNESKCPRFIQLTVENVNKTFNQLLFCAEHNSSLRREIKKQNGNILFFSRGDNEINQTQRDPAAELYDLLVKIKLLQLHYWIKIWYPDQKNTYPNMFWQDVIAPILPLIKHRRVNMVPKGDITKVMNTPLIVKTSLPINKILADPVFARNSTYRQIVINAQKLREN